MQPRRFYYNNGGLEQGFVSDKKIPHQVDWIFLSLQNQTIA